MNTSGTPGFRATIAICCLAFASASRGQPVVIHEAMLGADSEGFVEVFNASTRPVDMDGWTLAKGVRYTFTNVTVPARGFHVVAADLEMFHRKYPGVTNVTGNWTGKLRESHEALELRDGLGTVVSRVEFESEGCWALRRRGAPDGGHRGWEWVSRAESERSWEVIDPALTVNTGQNWAASRFAGGTPGASNSQASPNIDLVLILDVAHAPAAPRDNQEIVISARILTRDPSGARPALRYRVDSDGSNPFQRVEMVDGGPDGGWSAGDDIYGAAIPPQTHGTIIEYFVEVTDAAGRVRTWPPPALLENGEFAQAANCLLQVDNAAEPVGLPLVRLVLTAAERAELASIGASPDGESEAEFNATFIAWDGERHQVRHRSGIRHRGHGSRGKPPNSYRINLPEDAPWNGIAAINLNAPYSYVQALGNAFCLRAGLHAPWTHLTHVRLNGVDHSRDGGAVLTYGLYAAVEVLDRFFADRHFPNDNGGALYRGIGSDDTSQEADFRFLGDDPAPYRPVFFKQTNERQDDWRDLIQLSRVMSSGSDAEFAAALPESVRVQDWVLYLAVMAFMDNQETSPNTGYGDDFALYSGADDKRFFLLPYDTDTVLGLGFPAGRTNATFLGSLKIAAFERFLKQPEVAALYAATLRGLAGAVFAPERAFPWIDQLLGKHVPAPVLENVRRFIVGRIAEVHKAFPADLTIDSELASTTNATVSLHGRADAASTRHVRVNGEAAQWLPLSSSWSAPSVGLNPGLNRVLVLALSADGSEVDRATLHVTRVSSAAAPPRLDVDRWTPENDVIRVDGDFAVPRGRTLVIDPGSNVEFSPGARLVVRGRLLARGSERAPIQLRFADGASIVFDSSEGTNSLAFVEFSGSEAGGPWIELDRSRLAARGVAFGPAADGAIRSWFSDLSISASRFSPAIAAPSLDIAGAGEILVEDSEFAPSAGNSPAIRLRGVRSAPLPARGKRNRFMGGDGNGIELFASDFYLEGNWFRGFRQSRTEGAPAHAIAAFEHSEVMAVRNLFSGNDGGALVDRGSFLVSEHNTWTGHPAAAVAFQPWSGSAGAGRGARIAYDIFWQNGADIRPPRPASAEFRFSAVGTNAFDPRFVAGDEFRSLANTSPARGAARNGLDLGWNVPAGVSVSPLPEARTPRRTAVFDVHGPGIAAYRYRLNGGAFSGPIDVSEPIRLNRLAPGPYRLEIVGENLAGEFQEEPFVVAWEVDPSLAGVVLNEILAANNDPGIGGASMPDALELYNRSETAVDLSGLSLSDDRTQPRKFVFGAGRTIRPGEHLVLFGGRRVSAAVLGFSFQREADHVWLFDAEGGVIDEVRFGRQLPGYSIARLRGGAWGLAIPSLGEANRAAALGDAAVLEINEWLAAGSGKDFIELLNPGILPVALEGCKLTVLPGLAPEGFVFPELSFIGGHELAVAESNGGETLRPDELPFKLARETGLIRLFDATGNEIDAAGYLYQMPNISEGRIPTGAPTWGNAAPTPGLLNPGTRQITSSRRIELITLTNRWRIHQTGSDEGGAWKNVDYDDQDRNWASGRSLFHIGPTNGLPSVLGTPLIPTRPPRATYRFRTLFRFPEPILDVALNLSHIVDDGAVFYLNGAEIYRYNMPPGPISSDTLASVGIGVPALLGPYALPHGTLHQGDNLLAVEVHQQSGAGDDLAFGMALDAMIATTEDVNLPPVLVDPTRRPPARHSGEISGLQVWGPTDGEHHVDDDVVLAPGSELRVLAGSRVLVRPGKSIRGRDARVSIRGTAAFPVVWMSAAGASSWGELTLAGERALLEMRHVDFQRGWVRLFDGARGQIEDSFLHDYSLGIDPIIETERAGPLAIRRCHFARFNELHLTATLAVIEDCLLEYPLLDAIDLDDSPPGTVVRDSTLRHGTSDNVDAIDFGTNARALIENCWIHDFSDKGVSVGDASRDIHVRNTLIHDCEKGIAVKDRSAARISRVTIARCAAGVDLYEDTPGIGGGSASVIDSILWANDTHFAADAGSSIEFSSSNITGWNGVPGSNNTSFEPRFRDPETFDYTLRADSPLLFSASDRGALGSAFPLGGMPRAVEAVQAIATALGPVRVAWDDPGFPVTVERARDGGAWERLAGLPLGVNAFTDRDVEAGARYAYRVHSVNQVGRSSVSASVFAGVLADADKDGMSDDWEQAQQLDSSNPADALEDADADGAANLAEFQAGTDPRDPRDRLELMARSTAVGGAVIRFEARAGRSYALEESDRLGGDVWIRSAAWEPAATTAWVEVEIDRHARQRFYRLLSQ